MNKFYKAEISYDEPTDAIFVIKAGTPEECSANLIEFFKDKVRNFTIKNVTEISEAEEAALKQSLQEQKRVLN